MSEVVLVPSEFDVPLLLETDRIRLRPLVASDVEKDFNAVISSEAHLISSFRPGGKWPKGLTIEKNLSDLRWHEDEFKQRTSFAYTVVALDESEVLGCVYIYPGKQSEYDAQIWLWVRESRLAEDLDSYLYSTVKDWIETTWPFERAIYPGRSLSHEDWLVLRSKNTER